MQELRDNEFDYYIARALRAEAASSPAQQQRVWESLRLKAAQQAILPPPAPTIFMRARQFAGGWGKARLISLYRFIVDDSVYRRAQHQYPPLIMRHQRPHSTFASAELMLLA